MGKVNWKAVICAAGLGLIGTGLLVGTPPGDVVSITSAAEKDEKAPPEIPPELRDPELDASIDLQALRRALQTLDRPLLMEQAEKLAAAEAKLGRPHRVFPSSAVYRVLLRALAEARDAAGLDRVEASLKGRAQEDLLAEVAQARKLMAAPRKLDVGPDVPVGEVSAEAIVLYNTFKEQIRVARVIGDAEVLRELKLQTSLLEELHPKQRGHLSRLADDSLAALPMRPSGEQLAMSRLVGFSTRGKPKPGKQ